MRETCLISHIFNLLCLICFFFCLYQRLENLNLAINSAKAVGCVVVGVDAHNIQSKQGKKWLLLGMVWQLIKMYLYKQITITHVPGLVNLLRDGEDINELLKLSPEEILLRWVNYQLDKVDTRHLCVQSFMSY